ncbi:MAG: hypothetical protein LBC89_01825 [Bacteroidales bacterium]|jgi:hypothetical protein|nr:hypothetical protein [Bacteroidales bacterium]
MNTQEEQVKFENPEIESNAFPTELCEEAKNKQNMPVAVISGIISGLLCAALWAGITVFTGYQIGYMAIGVGIVVGFVIRTFGKGNTKTFGVAGSVIALISCLLGDYLSVIGMVAHEYSINFFDVLFTASISDVFSDMFSGNFVISLLFYLIAISTGYKLSIRNEEKTEKEKN